MCWGKRKISYKKTIPAFPLRNKLFYKVDSSLHWVKVQSAEDSNPRILLEVMEMQVRRLSQEWGWGHRWTTGDTISPAREIKSVKWSWELRRMPSEAPVPWTQKEKGVNRESECKPGSWKGWEVFSFSLSFKIGFFILFFKFNWSAVDLPGCEHFCCMTNWFSHTYISIHSLSDSFPTKIITQYWVEFSTIQHVLVAQSFSIYKCAYANPKLPVHPGEGWMGL